MFLLYLLSSITIFLATFTGGSDHSTLISPVIAFFHKPEASLAERYAETIHVSPQKHTIQNKASQNKTIYFLFHYFSFAEPKYKYVLVNAENGDTEPIFTKDYFFPHDYIRTSDPLPQYLLLQKGNELFSYDVEKKNLQNLSKKFPQLNDHENIIIKPSVTEKDKFFLFIYEHNPCLPNELCNFAPRQTQPYFFDAFTKELVYAKNITFTWNEECFTYDSKNHRFFIWSCSQGVGNVLPLKLMSTQGEPLGEVVSLEEYGEKDKQGFIDVNYSNGHFFISESEPYGVNGLKRRLSKIAVIDPFPPEPVKDVYVIGNDVEASLPKAIMKKPNVFISYRSLLEFNDQNQVVERKDIPYYCGGYYYIYDDRLYYHCNDSLYITGFTSEGADYKMSIPLDRTEGILLNLISK